MKKSDKKYYSVKYPLSTTKADDAWLEREFSNARRLQVALIKEARKRMHKYRNDSETKKILNLYKSKSEVKKEDKRKLKKISKSYGLTEYSLYEYAAEYRRRHDRILMSVTANGVALNVYSSVSACLYRKGKNISIPKEIRTLSDNSGRSDAIRYSNGVMKYSDIKVKTKIKSDDWFRIDALHDVTRTMKIKRVLKKDGTYRYYLQISFVGNPPLKKKVDKATGEVTLRDGPQKVGPVGIDMGISTIAATNTEGEIIFEELGDSVKRVSTEIARLQRRMDRQRRANNPDNYNPNGTIKNGIFVNENGKKVKKKLSWVYSKRYLQTKNQLAELYRKRSTSMKQHHESLANRIIMMGDTIYIEKMRYDGFAKKAKKTEISEKTGRYKRKKRYGKSVGIHSPGQFVSILNRKLGYKENKCIVVNNNAIKASQLNHVTGDFVKKELNQRWMVLSETTKELVQRDLYSAFLLMNCKNEQEVDIERCIDNFPKFKESHDDLISELINKKMSGIRYPVCMGL